MQTILRQLSYISCNSILKAKGKRAKLMVLINKSNYLKKKSFQLLYKYLYSKYDLKNSKFFSNSQWTWYGGRDVHPIEDIQGSINLKFGERYLPVPIGYHNYLTRCYGDYMTPPPLEKRKSTHCHSEISIIIP